MTSGLAWLAVFVRRVAVTAGGHRDHLWVPSTELEDDGGGGPGPGRPQGTKNKKKAPRQPVGKTSPKKRRPSKNERKKKKRQVKRKGIAVFSFARIQVFVIMAVNRSGRRGEGRMIEMNQAAMVLGFPGSRGRNRRRSSPVAPVQSIARRAPRAA